MRLNITDSVLNRIGFSEYWDENGTFGTRTLCFENGERLQIIEQLEMDDIYEGYLPDGYYVPNYFYFNTSYLLNNHNTHSINELFFIEQLYEVIIEYFPNSKQEFLDVLKKTKMLHYIHEYLKEKSK